MTIFFILLVAVPLFLASGLIWKSAPYLRAAGAFILAMWIGPLIQSRIDTPDGGTPSAKYSKMRGDALPAEGLVGANWWAGDVRAFFQRGSTAAPVSATTCNCHK